MIRPPTTWVLLANEIKRTDVDDQDFYLAATKLADLIIEASERPADKLKKQHE